MRTNILLTPITCFLLALAALGQDVPKDFTIEYDKFKDITRITRKDSYIRTSNDSPIGAIIFRPYLIIPGNQLSADADQFLFLFRSDSTRCRGYCFIRSHRLIVMADGRRIDIGEGDWRSSSGSESMLYPVSRADLAQMVAAQVVEFQIGVFEGKFAPNDRATIKTLLELGTVKK